jgi:hypothetical protein
MERSPGSRENPPKPRIAVVIPALDEEEALPQVLADLASLQGSQESLLEEVIVVDNGSRDRTADIARQAGARVLSEPRRGYGSACLCALRSLRDDPPDVVLFMDADHSDDAGDIPRLLQPILKGNYDLVIGSRSRGQRERGALLPQARFGNWLATALIRLAYGFRYTDLGPFRAVRYRALERMHLADPDFGWTIEMQIRALQTGAKVTEVPVRYRRRVGRSKISGTLMGSIRAGRKILATFWRLRPAAALVLTLLTAASVAHASGDATITEDTGHHDTSVDHAIWDRLLAHYVDSEGRVAYRKLHSQAQDSLAAYMRLLARAQPDDWTREEQLAFWINAYNAGVIWAILHGESPEPAEGREKIFKLWKYEVAGKERTLDEVEHRILRPRFQEPRLHFAIVCAASSCPTLRHEAYTAARLELQLDEQARRFINDPTKNQLMLEKNSLRLSRIFDWFRADFEQDGTLPEFLARYAEAPSTRKWLQESQDLQIEFVDYDWTLNAQPQQRPTQAEP